jgi:hypothetical protein
MAALSQLKRPNGDFKKKRDIFAQVSTRFALPCWSNASKIIHNNTKGVFDEKHPIINFHHHQFFQSLPLVKSGGTTTRL